MNKIIGTVSVLSIAIALIFAQSTPTFADVVINNVLSPFTIIQIGPGHRVAGPPTLWVHNPRYHQRCYRQWDRHSSGWSIYCVRMRYWGGEPYWD